MYSHRSVEFGLAEAAPPQSVRGVAGFDDGNRLGKVWVYAVMVSAEGDEVEEEGGGQVVSSMKSHISLLLLENS